MKTLRRNTHLLASCALLACGLIWGSGFVVLKNTLDLLPVNWTIAFRFLLAALVLGAVCMKQLMRAPARTWVAGAVCGMALYAAYFVQTYGLQTTTAGNNAFLTAVYVVWVPFMHWLCYRKKPQVHEWVAAVFCLAGVGFFSLNGNLQVNEGDMWTLLSSLLFALHIVLVGKYMRDGIAVMQLTALQFLFAALCALVAAALFEPFPPQAQFFQAGTIQSLLYLGVFCTLVALVLQNVGLRYTSPAHASLLMSTEAPFGFLFGVLLLGESFAPRYIAGAAFILGAILLSELGGRNITAGAPAAQPK